MIKFCTNCYTALDREYEGKYCPVMGCSGKVVDIDEMIYPAIKIFNAKGYRTLYCCSSHFHYHAVNQYVQIALEHLQQLKDLLDAVHIQNQCNCNRDIGDKIYYYVSLYAGEDFGNSIHLSSADLFFPGSYQEAVKKAEEFASKYMPGNSGEPEHMKIDISLAYPPVTDDSEDPHRCGRVDIEFDPKNGYCQPISADSNGLRTLYAINTEMLRIAERVRPFNGGFRSGQPQ